MKRTLLAAALFCAMSIFGNSARAEDAFAWTYRYMVAHATNDAELFTALSGIARTPAARTRENYDLLAQLLIDIAPNDDAWPNSAPNIARMLANGTEAARYYSVLDSVRRRVNAPGSRDDYNQRLLKLKRENAEQYVPGTIDIAALREAYVRAALAVTPTMAQAEAIVALPMTATLNDLFAAAGTPAHIEPYGVNIKDVIAVEVRQLRVYYRGIGRLAFDYKHETGWNYYNLVAEPMTFEAWMPYRAQAKDLGLPSVEGLALAQLLSGNPSAIKVSAQTMHRAEEIPVEYMDTAAELLLRDYKTIPNAGAVDAYAWICNVLAERGGSRYQRVLATVKKNTSDKKLARFAGQRSGTGGPEGVYAPGATSLDAQKAKYPPLYPQMTLVRGLY